MKDNRKESDMKTCEIELDDKSTKLDWLGFVLVVLTMTTIIAYGLFK
jgi:hypothetical protein